MLIQNLSETENPGEKYGDNYAKLFKKSGSEGRRLERERERERERAKNGPKPTVSAGTLLFMGNKKLFLCIFMSSA
jgi:hypothetical protein